MLTEDKFGKRAIIKKIPPAVADVHAPDTLCHLLPCVFFKSAI